MKNLLLLGTLSFTIAFSCGLQTQKPGFFESKSQLSLFPATETRFLLLQRETPKPQKPGFFESKSQLSLESTEETRFLLPQTNYFY